MLFGVQTFFMKCNYVSLFQYFVMLLISVVIIGCGGPVSRLYETPAIYPVHPQLTPDIDSLKNFSIGGSIYAPTSTEIRTTARVYKNLFIEYVYSGNLGQYSNFSGVQEYRFKRNSTDLYVGYHKELSKSVHLYLYAGYGNGKSISIVPEYDNSVDFVYKGNFNRFTINPGFQFNTGKSSKLTFGMRQSFVRFNEYVLPDTFYINKKQTLSDLMVSYSFSIKRLGLKIFLGHFLNGQKPGNRQNNGMADVWRIEKAFGGFGLNYKFRVKSE